MKEFTLLILVFMILFKSQESLAFKLTPEICREYGLGRNWYCSNEEEKQSLEAQDVMSLPISPEEKAILLNELWELQRKRAVITEDKAEIVRFLATHNLIASKGMNFARNVSKVIETSPHLANSESYYKNLAESQLKNEGNKEILKSAANRYSLVFIYSTSCPHCLRQYPIIQRFKGR